MTNPVGICRYLRVTTCLNRGPEAAMSYVETKLVNASGKMAKLLGTDQFLDGQGTNSSIINLDGLQAAIDDGTTYTAYAGVTRTDIASGANVGINGYKASAATLSLAAVQTAYGATWFGNEHVDLMPTTQVVWDVLWNKIQPQQRFLEESSDVARVGQLQALLGSDPFENGGEVEEPCDGNLEPSIAFDLNAKARVETMGHPLVKQGEEIVRATGNNEPVGKPFQALRYNGASIVVDQYAPAGVLWFLFKLTISTQVKENTRDTTVN